jgi:hypothetical protein
MISKINNLGFENALTLYNNPSIVLGEIRSIYFELALWKEIFWERKFWSHITIRGLSVVCFRKNLVRIISFPFDVELHMVF